MNNKKILLVTRPLSPPWDEASKNFAYFLAKNVDSKFNLAVLTSGEKLDLKENVEQIKAYSSSKFDLKAKLKLFKFLRKNCLDFPICHFLFTPAKKNVSMIKSFLPCKKVKTIQTVATLREDLYSDKEIKKLMFADRIVTYSDYSKDRLEEMGIENVSRVYPGIDLEKYKKMDKCLKTLAQFNLRQDDFIITFPGEFTRLGSIDEIIEAFSKIAEEIYNAKLVLACRIKNQKDLIKKNQLVQKIKDNFLEERIVFTDTFSDMEKLYNISDVILFPVHNMNGKFDVPLVIPEAQACEKPVIVSDLPIFKEFALPNNSVTIKKGSVFEIFKAVVGLYNDPKKREELGKNGRKFVEKNFDIKSIAKEYEKIYEQI